MRIRETRTGALMDEDAERAKEITPENDKKDAEGAKKNHPKKPITRMRRARRKSH